MDGMRKLTLPIAIFAGGMWINTIPLRALPEYTEKEKKDCAFCHPAGDLFALNDAGKYYAEHHSFEGYEAPEPPAPPKPEPAKPKP
ncbi:MAG: hypothetical protein RL328_2888 [Acidobacteriota bacterium]|jgi:hypothetical protein